MQTKPRLIKIWGIIATTIILFYGCRETFHNDTEIGTFQYQKSDSRVFIRIKKLNGLTINIDYENGKAKHKWVWHPEGHPLKGRIRPTADGNTLNELTELFPNLVQIAKGEEKSISDRVLRALEDYPADRYRLLFEEQPGKFYMELNNSLFLKGYDSNPNARMPYLAYWGPRWTDGVGDDVIYCGWGQCGWGQSVVGIRA